MTLGTFQPRARLTGDKLDLRQYAGRPLLVRTTEFVPDFTSTTYPQPKPVVFADVVDLISGQIFINVLWGAGAVVDNLKDKAGTEEVVPVKAANIPSTKRAGTHYVALFPLEGAELDAAVGWYNTSWGVVDQTRMQRQQAAAPAATPAQPQFGAQGQPMQNGVPTGANPQFGAPAGPANVPPGGAPAYGQGAYQQQPNPAAQAPATQFGAPATQPPANPAYAPQGQPQYGQPQAQAAPAPQYAPAQGFGAPAGGVFTDVPPAPPAGAAPQFAPPVGQDPAAAQAALNHLNQHVPQG